MKKLLMKNLCLCLLVICSFVSCDNSTELKNDTENKKSVTEVVNSISVTAEYLEVTISNSEKQIFTTKSEDGNFKYIISENIIKDLQENEPYPER